MSIGAEAEVRRAVIEEDLQCKAEYVAATEAARDALLAKCLEWHEVGSRATCNPPVMDTDRDYLCLVIDLNEFVTAADAELGCDIVSGIIKNDNSATASASRYPRDFTSIRAGEFNLIATDRREFFNRFMAATRLAKRFNLLAKDDRIALFQAVLYGNG